MKLVVGLGNPGEEYARTRHNLGYLVADAVAGAWRAPFSTKKFGAEIAEAKGASGERVFVMKPLTYMNHSGEAVGGALRFWKIDLQDLVVVHDELELEPFRVKVQVGGGHSGHNGVKSVNAHVGTPEYCRVRIGVGRPPPRIDPADYVLGRFSKGEEREVEECVAWAAEAVKVVVTRGVTKAMNEFNRRDAAGRSAK